MQTSATTTVQPLLALTLSTIDDNDYFFINSNKGLAGAATSMAGFEGAYTASSATPGLENHRADAGSAIPGMGYTAGDLDGVSYQPLSGNVSAFMLGGN